MAWEISMTPEGWQNVWCNVQYLAYNDAEQLIAGIASDETNSNKKDGTFSEHLYKRKVSELRRIAKLSPYTLAEIAYNLIEQNNTCDNGGWNVYLDNGGYTTIPVELIDGAEEFEEN